MVGECICLLSALLGVLTGKRSPVIYCVITTTVSQAAQIGLYIIDQSVLLGGLLAENLPREGVAIGEADIGALHPKVGRVSGVVSEDGTLE